ncbi:MAG: hypothetical protein C4297_14410 [Gemmataceae bacterium]
MAGGSWLAFPIRLGYHWRTTLVVFLLLGTVFFIAGYCYWNRSFERLRSQAYVALDRGELDQAAYYADLLAATGYADYARLVRGRLELQDGHRYLQRWQALRMQGLYCHAGALCIEVGLASLQSCTPACQAARWSAHVAAEYYRDASLDEPQLRRRAQLISRSAIEHLKKIEDQELIADAAFYMAQAYLQVRETGVSIPTLEVVRLLRLTVDRRPELADAYRLLAALYLELGATPQAIEHLTKVAELDPRDGRPYRMLGLVHRLEERTVAAIEAYRQAWQRDLSLSARLEVVWEWGELLIEQGRASDVENLLEDLPAAHHDYRVLALDAFVAHRRGQPTRADQALERAIAQMPADPSLWALRARIASEREQLDEAIRCYQRAVAYAPSDYRLYHRLAEVYRLAGKKDDADKALAQRNRIQELRRRIQELNRYAAEHLEDDRVRCTIGSLFLELGDSIQARAWYRSALAINPACAEAQTQLSRLDQLVPQSGP